MTVYCTNFYNWEFIIYLFGVRLVLECFVVLKCLRVKFDSVTRMDTPDETCA